MKDLLMWPLRWWLERRAERFTKNYIHSMWSSYAVWLGVPSHGTAEEIEARIKAHMDKHCIPVD
jgi:hypothetical protein